MENLLVVHIEKCLACKTCQIECAVAHSISKELVSAISEAPRPRPRVSVEEVENFAIPLQCRHCEDAPCIKVCPTEAIVRADKNQPVAIDSSRCIGCKWCVIACPFGVISLDAESRVAIKCDLCMERLQKGEQPACVAACPTGALTFVKISDFVSEKRKKAAEKFLTEIER